MELNPFMPEDIRDKLRLDHEDIVGLNFVRMPGLYHYRRHYRTGLRSHIMEVLDPADVEEEKHGTVVDGIRRYVRARPLRMLRLFRTKFESLKGAEEELARVKTIGAFLAPDHLAMSEEFLVDYESRRGRDILLCGLQDYVRGEILDPWGPLNEGHLVSLLLRMGPYLPKESRLSTNRHLERLREQTQDFVERIKEMILNTGHIPDLSGVGNLLITPPGDIKLVDINNISLVRFDSYIRLDDMGYPVGDKSIEALFHLERKVAGRPNQKSDIIFKTFLEPGRMKKVRVLERKFHLRMGAGDGPRVEPSGPSGSKGTIS